MGMLSLMQNSPVMHQVVTRCCERRSQHTKTARVVFMYRMRGMDNDVREEGRELVGVVVNAWGQYCKQCTVNG